MDEKTVAVVFEVEGKNVKKNSKKKAKTELTKFYAHPFILQHCAPQLAKFCGEEVTTTVSIRDVTCGTFCSLLSHLYERDIPENEMC